MTIDEKRHALNVYCGVQLNCSNCRLNPYDVNCSTGMMFDELADAEIETAYGIVFEDADAPSSGMGLGDPPHVVTIIKDSGDRRQFDTGAVRDMSEGKGRMDLLPWAAILEVSKHAENGSKKYGAHNVDKGIPTSSLCDSGMRHLAKYLDGWDDEPHLLAAAWNLLWAIQMEIKHPEVCDIPWKEVQDG